MHHYSTAPFFRQILVPIFGVHVLLTKITTFVLESFVIHWHQLTEHLAFDLLNEIIYCIPIDKVTFLRIVSMQIEIES